MPYTYQKRTTKFVLGCILGALCIAVILYLAIAYIGITI